MIKPTFPGFPSRWGDLRFHQGGAQRNLIAATPVHSQIVGLLGSQGCNPLLCVHRGAPLPSLSVASDPSSGHAGAGGARSRAISIRISFKATR